MFLTNIPVNRHILGKLLHCTMLSGSMHTFYYYFSISLTDDKGLLGLSSMLVVPGGPAGRVDGPFGRAQEGRLGLALAGGPLPGREACADRLEEPVQGSIPTAARKKHHV